jgi:hypothetical protein
MQPWLMQRKSYDKRLYTRFLLEAFQFEFFMQIKIDEDLPRQIAMLLRERGYQSETVVKQGLSG